MLLRDVKNIFSGFLSATFFLPGLVILTTFHCKFTLIWVKVPEKDSLQNLLGLRSYDLEFTPTVLKVIDKNYLKNLHLQV